MRAAVRQRSYLFIPYKPPYSLDAHYSSISHKYEEEQNDLRKSIPDTKAEIDALKTKNEATDRFTEVIEKYTEINELNAEFLNELIDKIIVHHKEKSADGKTCQQIEIYYRFIGKLASDDNSDAA